MERLQKALSSRFGRERDAYLEAEDLRLNQRQGTAVDLDEALASLDDKPTSAFLHVFLNLDVSPCPKSKRILT